MLQNSQERKSPLFCFLDLSSYLWDFRSWTNVSGNKQLTICQKQIRFMHKRPMSFLWRIWLLHTVNPPLRHYFVCNCIKDLLLQRLNHLHSFSFSTCTLVLTGQIHSLTEPLHTQSYSLNINSHHLSIKYIAGLPNYFIITERQSSYFLSRNFNVQ